MYQDTGQVLEADVLAAVHQAVLTLDLRPGPGGSFATDPVSTTAALLPLLSQALTGRWTSARVFGVYPSAQLVGHVDPPAHGTRYHIPIRTNPGCWVFHKGTWQQLSEGRVYTMDPTDEHGAVNWGHAVRLHVVIDQECYGKV